MRVGRLTTYRAPPFDGYDLMCLRSKDEAPGFQLMERLIQYRHDGSKPGHVVWRTEIADPVDATQCAEIALHSYTLDQFHRNRKINPSKADDLKVDWTRRLVEGEADRVHILWTGEGMGGYVATLNKNIELIAVAMKYRGYGYGRALVRRAIIDGAVTVGTQEDNPVRALYESLGFVKVDELNTYHWTR